MFSQLACFTLFSLFALFQVSSAWGQKEKVKLEDVQTLTLHHGKMTTSRRSSPVPQLQCVGGTAGCSAFVPQVVQCSNKGSDGFDVQWECKTDMDNAYRFGRIDVVCEGYDYANDPYVLKGSCGMEYTLDLTKEGIKRNQGHGYYGSGSNYFGSGYSYDSQPGKIYKSTRLSDILLLIIVGIIIYALYKTCLQQYQHSPTDDDSYGPNSQYGSGFRSAPPPPGFRAGYTPGYTEGCSSSQPGSRTGGGFWTGAMTGGLLGYMFGNRNGGYSRGYYAPPHSEGTWGGGSSFSAGDSSPSGSTGTRTASGFGGTRRR